MSRPMIEDRTLSDIGSGPSASGTGRRGSVLVVGRGVKVEGCSAVGPDEAETAYWPVTELQQSDQGRAGNQSAISRVGDSWPSEPWTRFSVVIVAKSPRIVPGSASSTLVAPTIVRTS